MPKKTPYRYRYLKIRDHNQDDRPREKLAACGRKALTQAELLGLLIGSGVQHMHAVDLARHILGAYDNRLEAVAKLSMQELTQFKGIGRAKAALIIAAVELGNRLRGGRAVSRPTITDSGSTYRLIWGKLANKLVEELWLVLLNSRNQVIRVHQLSQGGLDQTSVDKRVLLKECLLHNAVSMILVHNHPSGNPMPSHQDIVLTKNVARAAATLGLNLFDHIIFSDARYFSFADEGMIDLFRQEPRPLRGDAGRRSAGGLSEAAGEL